MWCKPVMPTLFRFDGQWLFLATGSDGKGYGIYPGDKLVQCHVIFSYAIFWDNYTIVNHLILADHLFHLKFLKR